MPAPTVTTSSAAGDRLRDIQALTDASLARLDLDDLLIELLDRTLGVLTADTAAVLLLNASKEHLVATAARGIEAEVYQGARVPLGRGFAGRVAQDRRPVVIDDIDTAEIANPVLREAGLRSLLGVPLVAGGQLLGVLHVGTLSMRRFTDADVDLLQMVGDRVALATHATLAEAERHAAATLQRSLLPDRLPAIAGLEVAVRYSAGGRGEVGGDWYDMFALPSGWACITVGDVVGRGLPAAVIMGRVRSTLRAYALASPPEPAAILELVHSKLRHFEAGEMATAVIALVEPSLERMHVSLAGHPAPVLATPGRRGAYLDLPVDSPLGIGRWRPRRSTAVDLPPGATVAFYTDGLIERRDTSIDDRIDLLCGIVTAAPAEDVCIDVMAGLVGAERPLDDIALLVLERRGQGTAATPPS